MSSFLTLNLGVYFVRLFVRNLLHDTLNRMSAFSILYPCSVLEDTAQ